MRTSGCKQAGRTLIELLIAMVLSLMIVAAVGSLYSFSSQSSRTAQQLGSAEERGRLALHLVGEPIALAGFGNINSGELGGATGVGVLTFKGPHLRACTNGRFANPAINDFTCVAAQAGAPGDQLFVSYQAESVNAAPQGVQGVAMTDCLGQIAPAVTFDGIPVPTVINVYSVEPTGGGGVEFSCTGNGGLLPQGLVRDAEDFKVFLALDSNAYAIGDTGVRHPSTVPSQLLSAAQVNALPGATLPPDSLANPWNHVVAVYVCIQLRSTEGGITPDGDSVYQPCPQNAAEAATGTAAVTLNDGVARRSFTQVFTIRSRAQAHAGSQG